MRTLGSFEVLRDGTPLGTAGKGSPRTLDLLKAIIAFGGCDVAIEKITGTLWPDAEGDLAKGAFDVAVHRLRKLMGHGPCLLVRAGKVSLDPALCWLDVWEFRRQAQLLIDGAAAALTGASDLMAVATAMLDCYRGHFMVNEVEQAWLLGTRAHLQRQFERAADAAGMRLQELGWHRAATALYRGVREAGRVSYAPPI
jgi:DNA-binding SARP family transcriptional activator